MQGIYGGIFDADAKKERIEALEVQMSEGSFWDDQSAAQTVITEANRLKNVVNPSSAFRKEIDDLKAMLELCLLYTSPSPRDVEESRMPCCA